MERRKPSLCAQGLRTRVRLVHTTLMYDNLDVGKHLSREGVMQASYLMTISDTLP